MINNLKKCREARGLTQQQLADLCGIARNTVSAIERDEWLPTLKLAYNISAALFIPVPMLFDFTDEYTYIRLCTVCSEDPKFKYSICPLAFGSAERRCLYAED